jgi:hypothetical protein
MYGSVPMSWPTSVCVVTVRSLSVARATPKRDYYVKSPQGNRLVRLDLGPVARAFLSTPDGMTLDAARDAVESMIVRDGGAWRTAWLRRLGLEPPVAPEVRKPNSGVPNADEFADGPNVRVNHRMEGGTNAGSNSAELRDLDITNGIASTSDMLEGARRFLSREIEDQISRGEEARGVPGQDGLVDEILGEHGLSETVRGDDDDVFALREEIEGQDAFDRRPMDVRGPLPFEIGHRFEAAEARVLQAPFDALT